MWECRAIITKHEAMMIKLATSIAALTVLGMGTAFADMAAGALHCSSTESELIWEAASPSDLLLLGSKCGFSSSEEACPTTGNDLLAFVEKKGCTAAKSGPIVQFVCTGNNNKVKKLIEDLCKEIIP